eukprot:1156258-Pelagomonas_calceolata.AAC.2
MSSSGGMRLTGIIKRSCVPVLDCAIMECANSCTAACIPAVMCKISGNPSSQGSFATIVLGKSDVSKEHELEVFLPPRAQVLPKEMREGYAQTQRFKYGLLKVGKETTLVAGTAGVKLYDLREREGLHRFTCPQGHFS